MGRERDREGEKWGESGRGRDRKRKASGAAHFSSTSLSCVSLARALHSIALLFSLCHHIPLSLHLQSSVPLFASAMLCEWALFLNSPWQAVRVAVCVCVCVCILYV